MQVLTELKQRGVQDILIACVDGLKGFPEASERSFTTRSCRPASLTCSVRPWAGFIGTGVIRQSIKYFPRREREPVARDLKTIYSAVDADAAQRRSRPSTRSWASAAR
jgi:putative transposase